MVGGSVEGPGYRSFRILFERGAVGLLSDAELIERFLDRGSAGAESAFAALVERHGPMVLSACRRALGDPHDAQDAFQATFLTLARRAGSIRNRDSLASWLFGVSCRVSARMRARRARRRAAEGRAGTLRTVSEATVSPAGAPDWAELHEELARLPEAYRAPTVLCYLEQLTNEEAAARLRLPVGTVKTRLRRARDLLRSRLAHRGEASAMAMVAALRPDPSASAAAQRLSVETARIAVIGLSSLSDSAIPPAVAALCRGVLHSTLAAKCAIGAAGLLVAASTVGFLSAPGDGPPPRPRVPDPIQKEADRPPPAAVDDGPGPGMTPRDDPGPGAPGPVEGPDPGPGDGSTSFGEVIATPDGEAPTPLPPVESSPGAVPAREPSVEAPVLTGITIDGDLSDWPRSMARYAIEQNLGIVPPSAVGQGYLEGEPPPASDLSASFAAGYDPGEQLLYLAVIVRDETLIVGNASHLDTDAVEVYVDGLRGERRVPAQADLELPELPVQQYVAIPGEGRVFGVPQPTNPILLGGDLTQTRTTMAFRREGEVTTYEWAIQVFDRYPGMPTRLIPGKRIGFDVAVADRDSAVTTPGGFDEPDHNRLAWIYWGPRWSRMKKLDAGALGELILGGQPTPAPPEPEEAGPTRVPSIEAAPLSGVEIDGDLSDWPGDLARHPIDHIHILPNHYGWNGLEGADLTTSPDLSAAFSVAYDPDADLVYLAVVVRDDRLVVGHQGFWDTDAVEVYVDGRRSEDKAGIAGREEEVDASEFPLLQYIGLPGGEGPVYGVRRSAGRDRGPENPILMFGDIGRTGSRMASRRSGGLTTYEWAVRPYDRYPDRPTDLVPGVRIGLDVAVADKDAPATTDAPQSEPVAERSAWLSWFPEYHGLRYLDASNLGELRLVGRPPPSGEAVDD
ncbi:sigma-70 family RNA polymerase sigma factor [Tautonia plasticadhaerens]|uniref:ECF RNA polymerase sigma factor SigW n=1 Tax=Tautonia plasticadhaerens TaxID=2527974 RepID=A0A518H501_9BACT|nr:sigma-70 family RNA polymerase sigma factor [Tautonia plasticadhaerens]QDV35924.1 ECF RNA polymerase sigma factor SigW [Tautonia plasticadhaerens]